MKPRPKILIVDDEPFNVDYLEQEIEDLGCDTVSAANGQEALDRVAAEKPDLVLLDIMMPVLDGFEVLARLKADPAARDIPVIVISALHDISSVVRGIERGAEDYLPKPFDPVLLQARIGACLEKKRLRDQEVEYLRQVERLTGAATAVEADSFEPDSLSQVAERADALGNLARIFQRMAREVHAREQRLKRQLEQLRLDRQERQQARAETAEVDIPMDRRQVLAHGGDLPDRTRGAALFADVSGFTPLTEALARELGFQRGAEELTRHLNRVFDALIGEVDQWGGSVVYFAGDAITCWFDAKDEGGRMKVEEGISSFILHPSSLRAVACALGMQAAMLPFAAVTTPGGTTTELRIKVAVAAGPARRFVVGDPNIQQIEALAGRLLDELAEAEGQAAGGEVVVQRGIADEWAGQLQIGELRGEGRCAVVTGLAGEVAPAPWPDLPPGSVPEERARPWLLPPVYEKVSEGKSELLSELRPAATLFLKFGGIDYDGDDRAGAQLDRWVRWVQQVVDRHGGSVLQLAVGDKGSYLYSVFGVPVAHYDDATRATVAALELQSPPPELAYITGVQIGVAHGQARAGTQGGATRRTYAALGDKTNLAARLMQAARDGVLCDDAIQQAARTQISFHPLPPMKVKGKAEPIAVYRPLGLRAAAIADAGQAQRAAERVLLLDRLSPADQLTLKAASVIGRNFSVETLRAIYPDADGRADLDMRLEMLAEMDVIMRLPAASEAAYAFSDPVTHETAYNLMLFAQRRELHRAVAERHEQAQTSGRAPDYVLLAHHWQRAEDAAKAVHYLEKAGEQAQQQGDLEAAERYFSESLALEAQGAVLSEGYLAGG